MACSGQRIACVFLAVSPRGEEPDETEDALEGSESADGGQRRNTGERKKNGLAREG
jgi:hypothetical protein